MKIQYIQLLLAALIATLASSCTTGFAPGGNCGRGGYRAPMMGGGAQVPRHSVVCRQCGVHVNNVPMHIRTIQCRKCGAPIDCAGGDYGDGYDSGYGQGGRGPVRDGRYYDERRRQTGVGFDFSGGDHIGRGSPPRDGAYYENRRRETEVLFDFSGGPGGRP